MKKSEILALLKKAYTSSKREDGTRYTHIDTQVLGYDHPLYDALLEMQKNLDASMELSYDVGSSACDALYDIDDIDELNGFDAYDYDGEFASCMTTDRLSYIDLHNQDEISEKVREYNCDIATAAAYWYDEQCRSMLSMILEYIRENGEDDETDGE